MASYLSYLTGWVTNCYSICISTQDFLYMRIMGEVTRKGEHPEYTTIPFTRKNSQWGKWSYTWLYLPLVERLYSHVNSGCFFLHFVERGWDLVLSFWVERSMNLDSFTVRSIPGFTSSGCFRFIKVLYSIDLPQNLWFRLNGCISTTSTIDLFSFLYGLQCFSLLYG